MSNSQELYSRLSETVSALVKVTVVMLVLPK